MNDGEEAPCVSPEQSIAEAEATGFPCPYRPPAMADDDSLIRIVEIGAVHQFGHVFQAEVSVHVAPRPDARLRMRMITGAMLNPDVSKILFPQPKEPDGARKD